MDLDVVFGRIILPPSNAFGDIWTPIIPNPVGLHTWGPFTAFRSMGSLRGNGRAISALRPYELSNVWKSILESPRQHGFDELAFSGRQEQGLSALVHPKFCVRHDWHIA